MAAGTVCQSNLKCTREGNSYSYNFHQAKSETGYNRDQNGTAYFSVIYLKDSTNWQRKQQHPNLLLILK